MGLQVFCIAKMFVLSLALVMMHLCSMDSVKGYELLRTLEDISRAGGTFNIAFYKYSRANKQASKTLRTITGCRTRAQLPHECFTIDGANYFLFVDATGSPKTCYRVLIRFVGLPGDNFTLKKVKWFDNETGN